MPPSALKVCANYLSAPVMCPNCWRFKDRNEILEEHDYSFLFDGSMFMLSGRWLYMLIVGDLTRKSPQ